MEETIKIEITESELIFIASLLQEEWEAATFGGKDAGLSLATNTCGKEVLDSSKDKFKKVSEACYAAREI